MRYKDMRSNKITVDSFKYYILMNLKLFRYSYRTVYILYEKIQRDERYSRVAYSNYRFNQSFNYAFSLIGYYEV